MEPETISNEENKKLFRLRVVTPLSKYLAMILFVSMPFIGGWIGYTYAPVKVLEIEKIVVKGQDAPVLGFQELPSVVSEDVNTKFYSFGADLSIQIPFGWDYDEADSDSRSSLILSPKQTSEKRIKINSVFHGDDPLDYKQYTHLEEKFIQSLSKNVSVYSYAEEQAVLYRVNIPRTAGLVTSIEFTNLDQVSIDEFLSNIQVNQTPPRGEFELTNTNQTVMNEERNVAASNMAHAVYISWNEVPVETKRIVIERATNATGPWTQVQSKSQTTSTPQSVADAVDGTIQDLFYRLMAFDEQGGLLKEYGVVQVPKYSDE